MSEASRLSRLKSAVAEFTKAQQKFSKFGARDTEPDGEFQNALSKAMAGNLTQVKLTAGEWGLYVGMLGVDIVADELNKVAQKSVDLIVGCSIGKSKAVRKYLSEYCWRVAIDAEED